MDLSFQKKKNSLEICLLVLEILSKQTFLPFFFKHPVCKELSVVDITVVFSLNQYQYYSTRANPVQVLIIKYIEDKLQTLLLQKLCSGQNC